MKLRYTVFDTVSNRYLKRFSVFSDTEVASEWTPRKAKAILFPGAKSARKVAHMVQHNGHVVILNAKGVIIG